MTDSRTSRHIPKQPRTLAITGGKGGVGKTSVALNLSLTLAREGYRVLLLDGDTDLANVSIMLGRYPERTLANVMANECSLRDVIMESEWGLHIIPGASGSSNVSTWLLKKVSVFSKRCRGWRKITTT